MTVTDEIRSPNLAAISAAGSAAVDTEGMAFFPRRQRAPRITASTAAGIAASKGATSGISALRT